MLIIWGKTIKLIRDKLSFVAVVVSEVCLSLCISKNVIAE